MNQKVQIGTSLKSLASDKKKDVDQENVKAWEEYIKNPSDIYDKEKNNSKHNSRRERFKFDLHGFTLDAANRKIRDYFFL